MSKFTPIDDDLHAYMVEHGARQDEVLRTVQSEAEAMGEIAVMQIAPDQGAFMTLLARATGAREALELGTFTGYSAICIARGLAADGRLTCCELNEEYAATASRNFEAAGLSDRIDIRLGPALDTLRALPERENLDLTFIDADKAGYPDYYEETLARTRPGGLILLDNVLRNGTVLDPGPAGTDDDENLRGTLEVNRRVRDDQRVDVAMVGIADGLTIVRKR